MEYTKKKRQQLLSKFHCPFTCDPNPKSKYCPFWHPTPQELSHSGQVARKCSPNLKRLPPYCCASFLSFACSKREYSFQCGSDSSAEILTRCEDGFHMELSELADLKKFGEKMAKFLMEASDFCKPDIKSLDDSVPGSSRNRMEVLKPLPSNYISAGHKRARHVLCKDDKKNGEDERSCAICLDQLKNHQIGHLDKCSHVFCAKCIHKWQNKGVNESCPVCRKRINKILVWPKLLQSRKEKKQLFGLISGGVPSDERVDRAMESGTETYVRTFEGKTMCALKMNPESMKVFLKKPKLNWNCYVMTDLNDTEWEHDLNSTHAVTQSQASDIVQVYSNIRRNDPPFTRHQPSIMTPINPNPTNRTSNFDIVQIVVPSNSTATNNAATNNAATNNVTPNVASTNPNSTNSTVTNNVAPNSQNNVQTIPRSISPENFLRTSDGRIVEISLSDLNSLFTNNDRYYIQRDIFAYENDNTSDNVVASADNVPTNDPS